MKFDSTEIAPSGRPALKLRVGIDEVEIIQGLLHTSLIHTPETRHTAKTIQRMKNMIRCLRAPEVQDWIVGEKSKTLKEYNEL